ncbi:fimbrial protein [Enterobacteriaceae bacterium RIT714]|nr:fimbrial protein [Enterobacteriaceae bacterium RIT714]
MRLNKMVVALGLGMTMVAGAANAADSGGQVTFKGSIISAACSIAPESLDQTVELGAISDADLKKDGQSTPRSFKIKLENCDTSVSKNVTTTFTGIASQVNEDNLAMVGTARGASIQLTDAFGTAIVLGKPTSAQKLFDGNNTLGFSSYLVSDGASATYVPGEFTTVANFVLTYA